MKRATASRLKNLAVFFGISASILGMSAWDNAESGQQPRTVTSYDDQCGCYVHKLLESPRRPDFR